MKAPITWGGDVKFIGESGTGHTVIMDGPEDHGGKNQGVRPMELLLLGMGGCTSFDVMSILKKQRQDVVDCVAEIEAERADAVPSVFTKIHIHFKVQGRKLREVAVEKAVALSAEKYCSASIMLEKGGVEITHSFEVESVEQIFVFDRNKNAPVDCSAGAFFQGLIKAPKLITQKLQQYASYQSCSHVALHQHIQLGDYGFRR